MKYLEELTGGSCFSYNNKNYLLTKDFRKRAENTEFFCIDIKTGFVQWMQGNIIVKEINLYYLDDDKNLIAIKEYDDEFTKNKNLH